MSSYIIISIVAATLSIVSIVQAGTGTPAGSASMTGKNLAQCIEALKNKTGGWCEIGGKSESGETNSISAVWPANISQNIQMVMGPQAVLRAWNSAAFDPIEYKFYFMGGGHADYGGNEVYQFALTTGKWQRLTDPSPLNKLFVMLDYGEKSNKQGRRLCWVSDVESVPASAHTYDGLIFSRKTRTIFLYVMGAANGSCFEDRKNRFKNSSAVLGDRSATVGWYEFNPDKKKHRNGLKPLTWRRVFDSAALKKTKISQGYPMSAELADGELIFGSRFRTLIYDPARPDIKSLISFTSQADWGDGIKTFDKNRNVVWSLHRKALLKFDGGNGRFLTKYGAGFPNGKSLAIAGDGRLYSWDGESAVSVFDPDGDKTWKTMDWGAKGPAAGDRRVYGKWVYLEKEQVFAGISTDRTGVWVYKHPKTPEYIAYATTNLNKLINQAKPGSKLKVPAGVYSQGLFVNKSLSLDLKGVDLRGVANRKGVVNVSCNNCDVTLENLDVDGIKAACLRGNCAGLKAEGRGFRLTLKNSHINNTVIGILTDNRGGRLSLDNVLIENSGWNDRSTTLGHGLYVGDIDRVEVRDSVIRRSFGSGHLFKSRAPVTLVENSVIAGLDGIHSRVVDFPCGGSLTIRNSVLQQGEQTDNIDLISVGTEPQNCGGSVKPSEVSITNSWIIFDRDRSSDERAADHGRTRFFTWRAPLLSVEVGNNIIVDKTGELLFDAENKVPDLTAKNKVFNTRSAAGLGPQEIPKILERLPGS